MGQDKDREITLHLTDLGKTDMTGDLGKWILREATPVVPLLPKPAQYKPNIEQKLLNVLRAVLLPLQAWKIS